jgi:predicted nucleic acid-binding protein
MIIIVDTNIVFSAILNTKSVIGELVLNSEGIFEFWSCHYLLEEIDKHWDKLKKISKLEDGLLIESQRLIYKNINFISEAQIPKTHRLEAYNLIKDIDLDDIVFIALNEYQNSILWTGDKVLITGLKSKGYDGVISTNELVKLRRHIEKKQL